MILRLFLFSLYIFGILFCGMTFVKAQAFGTMCFPLGTLAKQAAQQASLEVVLIVAPQSVHVASIFGVQVHVG